MPPWEYNHLRSDKRGRNVIWTDERHGTTSTVLLGAMNFLGQHGRQLVTYEVDACYFKRQVSNAGD